MGIDKNHKLRSGKYAGKTVNYIYTVDRRYFNWVVENRPEMLKSHKKQTSSESYNKPYKKPVYADPPDVEKTTETGWIPPGSVEDAFF